MMPPEGPNKAEELLQRYAKERRERGGDFSLHPATRRLLQGEVTRQFGKANATKPRLLGWFDWRRRGFAFGGAIAAVVIVGVTLVVATRQSSRRQELAKSISPLAKKELFLARAEQLAETRKPAADQPLDDVAKSDREIDGYADSKSLTVAAAATRPADATKPQTTGPNVFLFADAASNAVHAKAFDYSLSLAPAQNAEVSQLAQAPAIANFGSLADAQIQGRLLAPTASTAAGVTQNGSPVQFGAAFGNSSQVANGSRTLGDEAAPGKQAAAPPQNQSTYVAATPVPLLNAPQSGLSSVQEPRRNPTGFSDALSAGAQQETLARNDAAGLGGVPVKSEQPTQRYYRLGVTAAEGPVAQSSPRGGALLKNAESAESAAKVLSEFSVERSGDTMRLRDADGSVYEGAVVSVADMQLQSESEAKLERDKDTVVRERLAAPKAKSATAPNEVSFRVSGSNITSRQLVTVSGRFIAATNSRVLAARRLQEPAPSFGRQNVASNATQAVPAVIDGLLRVGASGEQPFRAVPAPK